MSRRPTDAPPDSLREKWGSLPPGESSPGRGSRRSRLAPLDEGSPDFREVLSASPFSETLASPRFPLGLGFGGLDEIVYNLENSPDWGETREENEFSLEILHPSQLKLCSRGLGIDFLSASRRELRVWFIGAGEYHSRGGKGGHWAGDGEPALDRIFVQAMVKRGLFLTLVWLSDGQTFRWGLQREWTGDREDFDLPRGRFSQSRKDRYP